MCGRERSYERKLEKLGMYDLSTSLEVKQRKDLAGLADTSFDTIPFGYLLSRSISVPFWELRQERPFLFEKGYLARS
jgi:hypothetical protein